MDVQLRITYEGLLTLIDQLSEEQQMALIDYLHRRKNKSGLSGLDFPVIELGAWPENWSLKRDDWYDDEQL